MQKSFKARGIELTDAVRDYASEKADSVLKIFGEDNENISCEIVLEKDEKHHTGNIFRADFTAHFGSEKVHSVGHGSSVFAAIDEAKDELVNRARHDKTKEQTLLRKGGAFIKNLMRFGK